MVMCACCKMDRVCACLCAEKSHLVIFEFHTVDITAQMEKKS